MSNRIGSLVFCLDCGNLLNVPGSEDYLSCDQCGKMELSNRQSKSLIHISTYLSKQKIQEGLEIITRSQSNAFPSSLRQKRALVQSHLTTNEDQDQGKAAPLMDEICPKCSNPQMKYHTLQLRSADEGTTVFYECPKCGHKFSTNN
ncbi:uncharacterized protein MELLADRAFT_54373 [Melampsora larici-populina 98AG31]|uniref:DNA-directed RNA polymerase subunit n=1 Tax=Melampsora larici-populina (strain 98AG31 / pathotype 3-4-7) TaxID=747676 RepID=F4SEN1_MELLP|nr:uncharacterized protein MELLADRAFT_54373 [Melampsora larici-populina 98AG31]EGF96895.1 hypothetical protein MELLADRAFT_54373 [Melampsora larici-populina 98AG31]